MPILGIYASSMQPALNASSYESIATVTVGAGGSSSISFTSIPSTYTHLQIRGISKWTYGSNASPDRSNMLLRLNSDSTSNYNAHSLYGNGTSAGAWVAGTNPYSYIGYSNIPNSNSSLANMFSASVIDILDYKNTNKNKTIRHLTGFSANGATTDYVELSSGLWMSTSAVMQIDIYPDYPSFAQYTTFALYGIK